MIPSVAEMSHTAVSPGRRWARAVVLATFVGLCLYPHIQRLDRPSLFADDVARVEQLQVMPPRAMIWRPFNEHLAPAFEVVSLTVWHLSGQRLAEAARAFTMASLLPLPLILIALGLLVRRETGSTTAALASLAVFALSPLPLETFWWYSASSFAWALLLTLVAWLGVIRGDARGRVLAAAGAFLRRPSRRSACWPGRWRRSVP